MHSVRSLWCSPASTSSPFCFTRSVNDAFHQVPHIYSLENTRWMIWSKWQCFIHFDALVSTCYCCVCPRPCSAIGWSIPMGAIQRNLYGGHNYSCGEKPEVSSSISSESSTRRHLCFNCLWLSPLIFYLFSKIVGARRGSTRVRTSQFDFV
jgi:hypothetical protein